jgi:anti-sigma regulatory factor (Ser/Thr protein kinase)
MANVFHVSSLHDVRSLREVFDRSLADSGIEGDLLAGWGLIFTELVNNALEHGCTCPTDRVRVAWDSDGSTVELAVVDPGNCPLTERDFDEADPSNFAEEGRGAGLYLIRAFVDEITVRPWPEGGTEIRLVRRPDPPAGKGGTEL